MANRIELHNVPTFYLEYMKNWLAHQKKKGENPAELAIVEDITKLVEVAISVLAPEQAAPETKN